ncbi:MAG: YceD family protein [Thiobacillaceae bacterium]
MFHRLSVNPAQFAAAKQVWQGNVPLGAFERLAEETLDPDALLHYRIEGGKDKAGHVQLTCRLEGRTKIACQRCLGPIEHAIAADKVFYPAEGPERAEQLERELDVETSQDVEVIETGRMLDLATLIEDEVLLGLPLIPMHAEGTCSPPAAQA